jgi:hypothetical protein
MTRQTKVLLAVAATIVALGIGTVVVVIVMVVRSGVTRPIDNEFGDQHLKTAVALIELHKVRNGHYPQQLSDLRFLGGWDGMSLGSVDYCANADGTAYFIEVTRGWVGRPLLKMPDDFWRGTGFDPNLGPCK